jgi:spermidine synthase
MIGRCIYREENEATHLEIWDEGDCRSLWFDDVILQSEIHIHDPAVLPNPVNRAMLAHLMLDLPLQKVLLAGCGGGAVARWLHARAPEVVGDAVELSPTVARLAHEYFDFPPAQCSNWQLLVDDVREHLALGETSYDFILVDLEENQVTPAWVTDTQFLQNCHARLNAQGVLTLNLILHDNAAVSEALLRVRRIFGTAAMLVSNPEHDNLLVLAFRTQAPEIPAPETLEQRGRRWGIDFTTLAAHITRLDMPPFPSDRD